MPQPRPRLQVLIDDSPPPQPLEILQDGTADEVRAAVGKALAVGSPGSGFVFGTSHSVAVGTPYDNFMAMIDGFEKVRDRVGQS